MQIYLARNNQQAGPYSLEQINQMLASQQVLLTDLAWHQGMSEWKALGELTQGKLVYEPAGSVPAVTPPFASSHPQQQIAKNNTSKRAEAKVQSGTLPLASFGSRFLAKVLDLLLWVPALFIPAFFLNPDQLPRLLALKDQMEAVSSNTDQALQAQSEFFQIVLSQNALIGMLVYIVLMLVVQAFLLTKSGQSIGKKIAGIKIVDAETNGQASLNQVFILRSLVFIILNIALTILHFLPFIVILDLVFAFNPQRQTLHDKLAKTKVVKL